MDDGAVIFLLCPKRPKFIEASHPLGCIDPVYAVRLKIQLLVQYK